MTTHYSSRSQAEFQPQQPTAAELRAAELQQLRHRVIDIAEHRPERMKAEADHYMEKFLNQELTKAEALEFISDTWGNERLTEQDRSALQHLNQQPKLSDHQMDSYIDLLGKGQQAAMDALAYSPTQVPEPGWKIEHALNEVCAEAIRERSLDYPVPSITSATSDTSMSFNELANLRLEGMDHQPHNLDLYEKAIYRTHQHATLYSKQGEPPHWFDPKEMTVTTEMWRQGYNPVNNGSLDPNAPLEDLADKLQHRMNLLAQQDPREPGISQLDLTRLALRPMLHQEFARYFDHHDPPHANYSPDAGDHIPNDPSTSPYIGPTNSPHYQAAASYGHNLQERMALTGLGDSQTARQLAWQIQHNLPYLNNMGEWAREATETNTEHPLSGACDPPLNWTNSPERNWQELSQLTGMGQHPEELGKLALEYQERALSGLTRFDNLGDYLDETRHTYLQDIRPPDQTHSPEHPHNHLLREAMEVLDDVRSCMHRANELMTQDDSTPVGEWDSAHLARLTETHALSQQAHEALDEMNPHTAAELLANTGQAAVVGYYARAVRQLAHADFVISNVQHQIDQQNH